MVNVPRRLEFPYMSYPTKTYKVHPFYKMLFDSIFEVLNNQKSPFLEWIMDKHLGTDVTRTLSQHNYNGLFIDMVNGFEQQLHHKQFDELTFDMKTKNRFVELMGAYRSNPRLPQNLTIFTVRISSEEVERVHRLKNGYLLKEVVHYAILNYLYELDELTYELVKNTFRKAIENKSV